MIKFLYKYLPYISLFVLYACHSSVDKTNEATAQNVNANRLIKSITKVREPYFINLPGANDSIFFKREFDRNNRVIKESVYKYPSNATYVDTVILLHDYSEKNRIRSTRYSTRWLQGYKKDTSTMYFTHDIDGRLLFEKQGGKSGNYSDGGWSYSYYKQNLYSKVLHDKNFVTVYKYDTVGNCLQVFSSEYDLNNMKLKNTDILESYKNIYDVDKRLVQQTLYDEANKEVHTTFYKYDAEGQMAGKVIKRAPSYEPTQYVDYDSIIFIYAGGQIQSMQSYYQGKKAPMISEAYRYNEYRQLVEYVKYVHTDEMSSMVKEKNSYIYNKDGNIERSHHKINKHEYSFSYIYEYY